MVEHAPCAITAMTTEKQVITPTSRTDESSGPEAARVQPRPAPRFSLDYLDRSTSPSIDFYRFAAGRWLDSNPIPDDKVLWSAFGALVERNFELLHGILEETARATDSAPRSPRRQVGDFYASAMDGERIERLGFEPFRPLLERLERIAAPEDVVEAWAELHRDGRSGAFYAGVSADKRDSSVYAFYLMQGGLSLPDRDYYLKEEFAEIRKKFVAHMSRCWSLLGVPAEEASRRAGVVLALETELAQGSRTRTELRDADKNYQRFTPAELVVRYPHLGWDAYLRAQGLTGAPHVIVGQPEYLDTLDRLLVARPVEAWRTYLAWHAVKDDASYLHAAIDEEHFDFFERTLRGQQAQEPRWRRASRVIDGLLGEALGKLYVERYFPAEARARMAELVGDLQVVFRDRLSSRDWMSPETRAKALEKFSRFTVKIGHPDTYRDYSAIPIDRSDYLGNVRRAAAFDIRRDLDRVGAPVDRTEWGMTPPTVNAYFNPTQNEIVFPAGILQPPFFDPALDDAVNYGAIGAVIGHEITHGYDDQGRKYDAEGNLGDWWTADDAAEFGRRAKLVVDGYSRFEALPGVFVNGELTLGENLADLGGLSIAYEALERRIARDPSRRRTIDGWTPEQRFFLSWAQTWRQNCRDEETRRRIAIDPHAPGRFRAVGAVAHNEAFGMAFNVPEGSPAYLPKSQRAAIW
jgi:putative endopeptidase